MEERAQYGSQLPWAPLAARQFGLVTRQQLLDLGLGASAIRYRLRTRKLIAEHRGVYWVDYRRPEPIAHAAAAVLAGGPTAALSHSSAAALWGLAKHWPDIPEITVTGDRRIPRIKIHRSRSLTRKDITRHRGIRVTTPARTLHDMAPRLTPKGLTRAVNDALLSRYLRLDDLHELVNRIRSPLLAPFVSQPQQHPTRSSFEDDFVAWAKAHGLPTPEVNVLVADYEVDILFRAEKVIIELDSWEHHKDREAFERDRERDAATLAASYITIRLTWKRLTRHADREAARLRHILQLRRATTTPADAHVARASGTSASDTPARSG